MSTATGSRSARLVTDNVHAAVIDAGYAVAVPRAAAHAPNEVRSLENARDRELGVFADGGSARFDVGENALAGAHGVAVGVPPALLGRVAGDAEDLVPLVAGHVQYFEDLHDVGEVGADVGVLQSGDLHAGLVQEKRQALGGQAAILAEGAQLGGQAAASNERAGHRHLPGTEGRSPTLCYHADTDVVRANAAVLGSEM